MARLQQGENFQEAPVVGGDGLPVDPDNQAAPPAPNAPKFGPKQIAIGAGIAVVLVVMLIFFISTQGSSTDENQGDADSTSAPQGVVTDPVEDDWFYDGEDTGVDSEWEVQTPIADPITDPYAYSIYSEDEVSWLRGYGYTGDEIEYYSQQGTSYDELIEKARVEKDKANEDWRQTVINEESEGYKALMEKTFLGSAETISSVNSSDIATYKSYTENVDYVKCGVYSYQAWIKLDSVIGPLMMNMPLDRYQQLADSGNIVITFTYAANAEGKVLFITEIKEKAI